MIAKGASNESGSTPSHLDVDVERADSGSTIRLSGELDIASAAAFMDALESEAKAARPTFVDLARLTFVDSTGLRALLQAKRRSDAEGFRLTMGRATGEVERSLELTGLNAVLPFSP